MTPEDSKTKQENRYPDYTPLKEIVMESEGMLVLDFPARIGARPYITFKDNEWKAVSVGPFSETHEGEFIMTRKEIEMDDKKVTEMLENARLVQLVGRDGTPIDEYDDWVY